MHEGSIVESALEIVFRHMEAESAERVSAIGLRVGALAGVVPEALRFAFAALTPGTPAEGATLTIEFLPTRILCAKCGHEGERADFQYECEACGSLETEVRQGRELDVMCIDLCREGEREDANWN